MRRSASTFTEQLQPSAKAWFGQNGFVPKGRWRAGVGKQQFKKNKLGVLGHYDDLTT